MKKICFIGILSILFMGTSFAQTRIGVTAGLNVSNITGEEESSDYKAGFQAGVVADFAITENFSIIPELLFSQRGFKGTEDSSTFSATLNYLQLPVNAAYKFDVGSGSKLFIFAGPYIGYGVSASGKIKDNDTGVSVSAPVKFGSNENEIKPFDFGIDVGVGYQYEKIFFKLQFNPGFLNLNNGDGSSSKNTNFAVSVGYFFN
jgi:opacity protein-like surface antigen